MCILYITFFSLGVVSVNNVKADTNSASNNTTADNIVVDNSSSQVIDNNHEDNNFSIQETNKVADSNYNYSADSIEKRNENVAGTQNNLTNNRTNLVAESNVNAKNGWVPSYDSWYYYDNYGNSYRNGWHVVDNSWYYFEYDGRMASNKVITDNQGRTYKIDKNGHYVKNQWVPLYSTWSYAGKNGEFLTQGWHVVDRSWYYFEYDKTIARDKIITDDQGRTYKMNKSGIYVKNQWVPQYNTWSYAGKNGEFLTQGWHVVDRSWYYFEYDKTIACDKTIMDNQGRQYRMDKRGHYIKNQWIRLTNYNGVTWLYAKKNGELLTQGWHVVDNDWYYFGYNGEMARNEFISDNQSRTYKIDSSGHYVKNQWIPYNTTWKYAGRDGVLLENTWAKIGGVWYYFDYSGSMAHNELIRDKNGNYYWINSLGYYVINRDIPYYGKILHAGADGRITNYY
ncbi:MAG TPA: hypothetical protein K8V14_12325 [Staphylococcus ureilyticus]|nr:hypothetical protein [Staphylococcus ureilyticus]HJG68092.1 hypothetical protein [Staphylococcus ureilyticus]